jgi:hypothetical protein
MALFVMGAVAVCAVLFLIMICIQIIKIEKAVTDMVDLTESRVAKMYNESGT